MNRTQEKYYPIVGGILTFAGVSILRAKYGFSQTQFKDIYAPILTISGTTIGFLWTTMAILTALQRTRIMAAMKACGKHAILVDFIFSAIITGFVVAFLSGINIVVGGLNFKWADTVLMPLWFASIVTFYFMCYRAISILAGILKHPDSTE